MSSKSYDVVTERIISLIEKGACPWRMPWSQSGLVAQANANSKACYRGINQILTMMTSYSCGYEYNMWLTYKQAKELGGQVRKGEKGCPIVRFGKFEVEQDDVKKELAFLRHFTVFNLAQIDDLPEELYESAKVSREERTEFERIEKCEEIVSGWSEGPEIIHGGNRACYSPNQDIVKMPPQAAFDTDEAYYATLFHELGHATGHVDRLARKAFRDKNFKGFGSYEYGAEELVAEFTSAFVCSAAGIDNDDLSNQTAGYLDNWVKAIKADPKLLVVAAGQAQKAADMILDTAAVSV